MLCKARDSDRSVQLADLTSGLEAMCLSTQHLSELMSICSQAQRDLVVHVVLAAAALLAQICCVTPPRQPFDSFTTWLNYAQLLDTLSSPKSLRASFGHATALHLHLQQMPRTAPFLKFIQVTASSQRSSVTPVGPVKEHHSAADLQGCLSWAKAVLAVQGHAQDPGSMQHAGVHSASVCSRNSQHRGHNQPAEPR
jgi:hypothetical protein